MKTPTVENLATIRVVYLMPYTLKLAGIPYAMRTGQSPRDLWKASCGDNFWNADREALRDWTNDWIDLDHPDAAAFVARLHDQDELPRYVHEYTELLQLST